MPALEITSVQNPRVKRVVKLRKHNERQEEQVVLIEGYREIRRAIDHDWPMEELFFCRPLFLGENEDELIADAEKAGATLFDCSEDVFRKMAYRDRPDGLLAVAPQGHLGLDDLPDLENPFLLVVAGIEKPGNLGTMLRTADGAGVDAVIVCDPVTDVFNPNTVRASVGTLFTVPVVECTFAELLPWLREQGISLLAATPSATRNLYETDLRGPVALAVGSEQLGLDDKWMEAADLKVVLPMCGAADSLNVSTAAALILYETLRQRMADAVVFGERWQGE